MQSHASVVTKQCAAESTQLGAMRVPPQVARRQAVVATPSAHLGLGLLLDPELEGLARLQIGWMCIGFGVKTFF